MRIIKAEIHKHNKDPLEKAQQKHQDTQLCNCTKKYSVLLNGKCFTESIVYQANITVNIFAIKKKFTLAHPKQNLKFAMVTTKNRLQTNIIKTIQSYPRSIGG